MEDNKENKEKSFAEESSECLQVDYFIVMCF